MYTNLFLRSVVLWCSRTRLYTLSSLCYFCCFSLLLPFSKQFWGRHDPDEVLDVMGALRDGWRCLVVMSDVEDVDG